MNLKIPNQPNRRTAHKEARGSINDGFTHLKRSSREGMARHFFQKESGISDTFESGRTAISDESFQGSSGPACFSNFMYISGARSPFTKRSRTHGPEGVASYSGETSVRYPEPGTISMVNVNSKHVSNLPGFTQLVADRCCRRTYEPKKMSNFYVKVGRKMLEFAYYSNELASQRPTNAFGGHLGTN